MFRGCMSRSISHSLVAVDFIHTLVNRKAWFCTLSMVAMFVSDAVLMAALLYSGVGLTYPMYVRHPSCLALAAAASIHFLVNSLG